MRRRAWAWPTEGGWLLVILLCIGAALSGGWGGLGIMAGFLVATNVLGNLILPHYVDKP